MAHQPNLLGSTGTFVIIGVAPFGRTQHDDLFNQALTQEVAHARETAVVGHFDPHAE
jgi:hypothetical protein